MPSRVESNSRCTPFVRSSPTAKSSERAPGQRGTDTTISFLVPWFPLYLGNQKTRIQNLRKTRANPQCFLVPVILGNSRVFERVGNQKNQLREPASTGVRKGVWNDPDG